MSQGIRNLADFPNHILTWDITYEPGMLKAIAKNSNEQKAEAELQTAGDPVKLIIESDTNKLQPDNQDVVHVSVRIVDDNGTTVYSANNRITCVITGPARLLGIEDANSRNVEDNKDNNQATYHGKALIYVQAMQESGMVKIIVSAEGLPSEVVNLKIVD